MKKFNLHTWLSQSIWIAATYLENIIKVSIKWYFQTKTNNWQKLAILWRATWKIDCHFSSSSSKLLTAPQELKRMYILYRYRLKKRDICGHLCIFISESAAKPDCKTQSGEGAGRQDGEEGGRSWQNVCKNPARIKRCLDVTPNVKMYFTETQCPPPPLFPRPARRSNLLLRRQTSRDREW